MAYCTIPLNVQNIHYPGQIPGFRKRLGVKAVEEIVVWWQWQGWGMMLELYKRWMDNRGPAWQPGRIWQSSAVRNLQCKEGSLASTMSVGGVHGSPPNFAGKWCTSLWFKKKVWNLQRLQKVLSVDYFFNIEPGEPSLSRRLPIILLSYFFPTSFFCSCTRVPFLQHFFFLPFTIHMLYCFQHKIPRL